MGSRLKQFWDLRFAWPTVITYNGVKILNNTAAAPKPVTVPSPKFRAVYRRKDKENEVEKVATHDALPTPQPLVRASLAPSQPPATTRATTPRTHAQPAVATSRPVRVTTTTAVDRTPPGCIADVTFLMDFSDGTGDKSKEYLDIAAAAVGRLPISEHAVRVSLIRFSGPGRTETLFHFDKHVNKDDLIEELFRMEPTGGTTRTGEALQYAIREFGNRKHGARKNARKFIVLFTDGYAQDDPATAADAARGEGITVVAVAVKDRFKPNELELVEITRNREAWAVSLLSGYIYPLAKCPDSSRKKDVQKGREKRSDLVLSDGEEMGCALQ
ncbi:von Willebrand factor type A domain protein [Teladorsagia circumcincta]|uniref:von Willebrand factor type A domain protein n=1 Tax=Teladorsagia circumcincta TaxID=45464 RepID=A0A2G9UDL9_TELCI|nr:von Willebrand factor type A domain protein [Teladorsagia circumcincta]